MNHTVITICPLRPFWWSRPSDCDFPLFICHVCIKCHWKPDHHRPDLGGLPPPGAHVFLPPNFSFLEISFTAVYIPRFLEAIITRDKTISYNCAAQLFFSIFMGGWPNFTFFNSRCHMLPSAGPCITQPSWAGNSAACLCSVLGWVGCWPFSWPLCFSSSWISVQCHWSLFVWLFPPFTIVLFGYIVPRNNWFILCFGYLAIHFGPSDFVLYLHYQD